MKVNQDKFDSLVGQSNSKLKEKLQWEQTNKGWLKKSAYVAVKTLLALKEKGITQTELAGMMGVTPQYVSKLLKGGENLSLETIDKLEQALGIILLPMELNTPKTKAETGVYELPVPEYVSSRLVVRQYVVETQTIIVSESEVKYGKSA